MRRISFGPSTERPLLLTVIARKSDQPLRLQVADDLPHHGAAYAEDLDEIALDRPFAA